MSSTCVIGMQWGDEAKAKIVDIFAADADVVVRSTGGANAGHTVVIDGQKFILHLIPAGILHPGTENIIGNGVVFDPEAFFDELDELVAAGIDAAGRIVISSRATLVMPYHKMLDEAAETLRGNASLGTTKRGIGPCYADKAARNGLRAGDLLDRDYFAERLSAALTEKNALLTKLYGMEPLDSQAVLDRYMDYGRRLAPMIDDTMERLHAHREAGKRIVFEGAQGSLLDVDHGTFPFVTSSTASALGMPAGSGTPPHLLGKVVGVLKAYTTRVGEGPFPTELHCDQGRELQNIGNEFGATTGRPRRCGWLDLVATGYVHRLNGFHAIALTKLDVLSTCETIKVCTAYELDGERTTRFPSTSGALERIKPVYEELPGWQSDIAGATSMSELPENCLKYIQYIQDALGAPVEMVSVGPGREETIVVEGDVLV
jgi:adenylosuccinate synthase